MLSGGSSNTNFRGFLIQASTMADGTAVGTFMVDGAADQQTQCTDVSLHYS